MRILRVIYDFPPPWTGLAPFPYELSLAQVENDHEVKVICGLWPSAQPKLPQLPKELSLQRILREPFKSTLFFTTAPLAFITIMASRLMWKPDVIQGHGQLPIYYHIYKTLFSWIDKHPYYLFLHITAAGRAAQSQKTGERIDFITKYVEWPLHTLSDKLGAKVAQHIFVTGEQIKQEVIDHYKVAPEKITVLENGVNTNRFTPEGDDKRSELGFSPSDKIIFVYGYSDRKNANLVVEALAQLPEQYKLMIVGDVPKEYREKIDQLILNHSLQNRVSFTGFIPYLEVAPYFRSCNIHVLPSLYEGFPKSILESLACGKPVITSGFTPEKNIQGLTILNDISPSSLASAIKSMNENVDVKVIHDRYSWSTMAQRVDTIL